MRKPAFAVSILLVFAVACQRTPAIDPRIAQEIAEIKAIDNHAHPVRPPGAGEAPDNEFDALPVDNLEAQSDPVRVRSGSPELRDARGGDQVDALLPLQQHGNVLIQPLQRFT